MDLPDPYEKMSPETREKFKHLMLWTQEDFRRFHEAGVQSVLSGECLKAARELLQGCDFIPPMMVVLGMTPHGEAVPEFIAIDTALGTMEDMNAAIAKGADEYMAMTLSPDNMGNLYVPIAISIIFEGKGIKREIDDPNPSRPPEEGEESRDIAMVYSGCLLKHMKEPHMATLMIVEGSGDSKTYVIYAEADQNGVCGQSSFPPYMEMFAAAVTTYRSRMSRHKSAYAIEPGVN